MKRSLAVAVLAFSVLTACMEKPRYKQPEAELVRVCADGSQYWRDDRGPFLVTAAGDLNVSLAVTLDEVCPASYL